MKKLEREALLADRDTVRSLLTTISDSDPLGQLAFRARLEEVESELARVEAQPETAGSVALLFAGQPVQGAHGIDAQFSSRILGTFQDLISKRTASEELGLLGARGPVPMHASAALSVTEMVRGSVGFLLEESSDQQELVDTRVKRAIEEVVDVIGKTGSPNEQDFEEAVETLDARILVSLRSFFRVLDEESAVIRIVEDKRDYALDVPAIKRGRQRIEQIEINDDESDSVIGELLGVLPEAKRFEMRLESGEVIRGRVVAAYAERYLELIEKQDQEITGRRWRTKMKIREVKERNRPPKKHYTLLGLIEPMPPDHSPAVVPV